VILGRRSVLLLDPEALTLLADQSLLARSPSNPIDLLWLHAYLLGQLAWASSRVLADRLQELLLALPAWCAAPAASPCGPRLGSWPPRSRSPSSAPTVETIQDRPQVLRLSVDLTQTITKQLLRLLDGVSHWFTFLSRLATRYSPARWWPTPA
jgi:hypothetical protein